MDRLTFFEYVEFMLEGVDPDRRLPVIYGFRADNREDLERIYARQEAGLAYAEEFLARTDSGA